MGLDPLSQTPWDDPTVKSGGGAGKSLWPFVLIAALFPIAIRLALLPWFPAPHASLHDEFGHLLVADTLASGRLANPPHPQWPHLEAVYVLHHPAYASIYPLGQGLIMAFGKVAFGSFWAGVVLAAGLMCGATVWMLAGFLPRTWSLAGGLLTAMMHALPWSNSYWRGAFCAFGGALLWGALCRLRHGPSIGLGLIAGAGWGIIWLIRPFESMLPLAVLWIAVLYAAFGAKHRRAWVMTALAIIAAQASAGALTLLHNRAVTGSYTTLPYQLSKEQYGVPLGLLGQANAPKPVFRFAQAEAIYEWQLERKLAAEARPLRRLAGNVFAIWSFFITPWFSIPLLAVAWAWRDRTVRAVAALLAAAVLATAVYPFFFAHYIAGFGCLFVLLVTRGLMMIASRAAVGGFAAAALLTAGSAASLWNFTAEAGRGISDMASPAILARIAAEKWLLEQDGADLVFVRYGAGHDAHTEWVYNAADVDRAPVVWCRSLDAARDAAAAAYFTGRRIWLAEVHTGQARLFRYQPGAPVSGDAPVALFGPPGP